LSFLFREKTLQIPQKKGDTFPGEGTYGKNGLLLSGKEKTMGFLDLLWEGINFINQTDSGYLPGMYIAQGLPNHPVVFLKGGALPIQNEQQYLSRGNFLKGGPKGRDQFRRQISDKTYRVREEEHTASGEKGLPHRRIKSGKELVRSRDILSPGKLPKKSGLSTVSISHQGYQGEIFFRSSLTAILSLFLDGLEFSLYVF
jgi:hypothetical protein